MKDLDIPREAERRRRRHRDPGGNAQRREAGPCEIVLDYDAVRARGGSARRPESAAATQV